MNDRRRRLKRPPLESVIPDLEGWAQLQSGMPLCEVERLIGPAIVGPDSPIEKRLGFLVAEGLYTFGYISSPSLDLRGYYSFVATFRQGRLVEWQDPFEGKARLGVPGVPELILPTNQVTLTHFPRLLDVRWNPVPGSYPILYTVEVCCERMDGEMGLYQTYGETTDLHCCFFFLGAQPGRVRVRASNTVGESAWSDPREFRFTR